MSAPARRVAALLLASSVGAAQDTGPAAVGERVPDHELTRLVGHDGRTRLAELYGQPVILAGWKRHFADGLHAASLADVLYRRFGDDGLLVVLQDREKWDGDPPWVEDVDFWYRFYGTPLWITESVSGENDPSIVRENSAVDVRSIVLIGVDGRLLLEARVDADDEKAFKKLKKELEGEVADEVRKRKKGWGEDRTAQKARGLAFGKGDLSGALKLLDRVRDDARVAEHEVVRAEVGRLFDARRKGVEYLLAEARYRDARDALDDLFAAVRGDEALAATLVPLGERLESDDGRRALEDDKRLARVLAPFLERELDDLDLDFIRAVREFAEEYRDSPVAERARRLDPLLKRVVRILRRIPAKEFEERVRDD